MASSSDSRVDPPNRATQQLRLCKNRISGRERCLIESHLPSRAARAYRWYMGRLFCGAAQPPILIKDRALAHLKIVVTTKLRRNESFTLSWIHKDGEAPGRSTIWLHPSIPLRFVFDETEAPTLNRRWIEELSQTLSSTGGVCLTDEIIDPTEGETEAAH